MSQEPELCTLQPLLIYRDFFLFNLMHPFHPFSPHLHSPSPVVVCCKWRLDYADGQSYHNKYIPDAAAMCGIVCASLFMHDNVDSWFEYNAGVGIGLSLKDTPFDIYQEIMQGWRTSVHIWRQHKFVFVCMFQLYKCGSRGFPI